MNIRCSKLLETLAVKKNLLLIFALIMISSLPALAEGTKDLRPTSADFGYLNPWDWGGEFATYNSPVDNRLNVHVADHVKEKIYLGFKAKNNPAYFRVKRPDGTIISGPHLIPANTAGGKGYIDTYAQAVAGPDKFNAAGYLAVVVDPDVNGDYYVEINQGSPTVKAPAPPSNGGYTYNLFDITVADTTTNTIKEGRVWAKQWALSTGNQFNFFNARFYVLRSDSIRFEVDYNGIDPFGFGIISNSTGIKNTGDYVEDRKSTSTPKYTQGNVPYLPEHKIFLNPPDENVYPFANVSPGFSVSSSQEKIITGCITSGYCVNVNTSKPGQAEVKLDLDAVPGYQPGGRDIIVYGNVGTGNNCIPWDGFDGLGDTAFSANIEINYKYESGFIHIPIYDAEDHSAGYIFTLLNDYTPAGRDTLKLYWDDSNFNTNPGTGINLSGCTVPCRSWILNYGNERFLNTWSFAFDQTITLANAQFDFCPPEVNNDTIVINENTTTVIIPGSNDIAPLNQFDPTSFQITCNPNHGTFVILPNNRVQYTPNLGFFGSDSICYSICDTNNPSACRSAAMLITVLDINLPPDATTVNGQPVTNRQSTPLTTPEDVSLPICMQWIEYEGQGIIATSSASSPSHGTLQNFADGDSCFTYVPNPDYFGQDTLTIVLCDDQNPAGCDTITIPIVVTPVNDPPVLGTGNGLPPIINDTISGVQLPEDSVSTICFGTSDNDQDSIYVAAILIAPNNGTLTGVGPGDSCFTYTPNPNFGGPDTVQIVVCDNGSPQICDTITVIYNTNAVNDPPVAVTDTLFADPGDTECAYVLGNDYDVETSQANLSFSISSGPFYPGASATIVGDSLCYTAAPGIYIAVDTVVYTVCDTANPQLCSTGYLLVAIPKSDTPPIAADDMASTPEDTPILINALINDIDPNFDPLTISIITQAQNGTAILQNDSVLYSPNLNFNGLDSIQYEVCDNTSPVPFCDTAWVRIAVTPVNDNPRIVNGSGIPIDRFTETTNEDIPILICLNALEVDPGQNVDVTSGITYLNNGTLSGLNNGDTCFTYSPSLNFHGIDSVKVFLCDNGSPQTCDSVVVLINILPVNDAPVAINDSASTPENTQVILFPLLNDSDPIDNSSLDPGSVTVVTNPANGSFVVNANGTISYTPNNGYTGMDSLEYRVCDTGVPLPGACATAWIFITVDPVNDPPVAIDDIITTGIDIPASIDVIVNDSDPENDNLTVSIISNPSNGTITLLGSTITYTPATGFCGQDSFEYRICDDGTPIECDSATVTINVVPQDDDNDLLANHYETLTRNTDGDGLNDYLDVDSDNDGISDSTEAQPIGGTGICDPRALDFDGDLIPDYLDQDSDNDCIPDWVERLGTNIAPTGNDSDNDGIDDAYDVDNGGVLINDPVDTDNDGSPDYRDTDSDGDGIPDWVEGSVNGQAATGIDSDGDGIDDTWDLDAGGNLCEDPLDTDNDGLPDFRDLDTDGDNILDTDEKGPNGNAPLDSDNDGIPDFRDTDSDNDGISDVDEGTSDCDDDGIPDYLDPDDCIPSPPTGFSPNGDGNNDTYIIDDNISQFPNNTFTIFNRWGNKVYEKSPYDNSWGGESNVDNTVGSDNKLPVGTYYYLFDYGVPGIPPITGFIYLKQ